MVFAHDAYGFLFGTRTVTGPLRPSDDYDEPYETEAGVLGPDGERYRTEGDDLVITFPDGSEERVEDFKNGDNGVVIFEGDAELIKYEKSTQFRDPIVIDLDGDGVEFLEAHEAPAYFDYDNDGFAERTAWISPDDGFLVADLNGDGKITEAAELFAENPNVGFGALAAYDSNGDGTIDASDENFEDLKIWVDTNCDGFTNDGELRSLAELAIVSIDVAGATEGGSSDKEGVEVLGTSTVTLTTGHTRDVAAANFASDTHDTRYRSDGEVDPAIAALTQLRGFGSVRDLDVAMTEDTVLRGQVEAINAMTSANVASFGQSVEAMIQRWHRVEDVVEDNRGSHIGGRHLAAIEAYAGIDFSNPFVTNLTRAARTDAGSVLQDAWSSHHSNIAARIFAQTDLGNALFPELKYFSLANLELDASTSITTVMGRMAAHNPIDEIDNLKYWISMSLVIQSVRDQFTEQGTAFTTAANAILTANGINYDFDTLRKASVGLEDGQVIFGHTWDGETTENNSGDAHDTLIVSGAGDDRIIDSGGTNTLVFGEGRGNDVIQTGWAESWNIDLVDLNAADVQVLFLPQSVDAVITIKSTGETLTIRDIARRGDINTRVTLQYADGSQEVIGVDEATPDLVVTDGDDIVIGTSGDDIIDAGAGDDTLAGGDGSDTYVINEGDGNDVITESSSDFSSDKLQIGANFADVTVEFVFSPINRLGDNLKFTLADGTSVTVLHASGFSSPIELFEFLDGTLTFNELNQAIDATDILEDEGVTNPELVKGSSTEANTFENTEDNEIFIGGSGEDVYNFASGDGSDVIADIYTGSGATNTLNIDEDFADVRFGLDNSNIIMRLPDGSFLAIITYGFGSSVTNYVFNDQTVDATAVFARARLDQVTLFGTDGDDTLVASDDSQYRFRDNILIGGLGDDYLDGAREGDTYIYNFGDGNDTILDTGRTTILNGVITDIDKLIIHGVSPDDVSISRVEDSNDDLVLTFNANGETITIQNQLENLTPEDLGVIPPEGTTTTSSTSSSEIEEIIFDDDTIWTADSIREALLSQASTDGNDTVNGFDKQDDTIEAGLGDDIVAGLSGSDTYVYNAGDGHDTIQEGRTANDTDTLKLVGIDPADLIVRKEGVDVVLTFAGSPNDSIRLTEQLNAISATFFNYNPTKIIEQIIFDDNTIMTNTQLRDAAFRAEATSGDDTINGTHTHETLFLSAGNDTLSGLRGDDLYLREADVTGDDVLSDGGIISFDTLRLEGITADQVTTSRDGSNVILTLPNGSVTLQSQLGSLGWDTIEEIIFDDVTWDVADITASVIPTSGSDNTIEGDATDETLNGTADDDTIDGKGGDDTVNGGVGSDLYIFGAGSGNDTITENGNDSRRETDRLQLTGLNEDDITVTRLDGNDISITINSSSETVTLDEDAIEFVNFADGSVWDTDTLTSNAWIRGTDGDDELTNLGTEDFTFFAGKGDDTINANNGGNNTYVFDVGDGEDEISSNGGDDKIIIRGVARENITFQREMAESNGRDLIIHYGDGDQITVESQLSDFTSADTLTLHLDDASFFTAEEMAEAAQIIGTDSGETIVGTSGDDIILAGAGDDTIDGRQGSDTYLWRLGDGNDDISRSSEDPESNVLKFSNLLQSDLTFSNENSGDLVITVNSSGEEIRIRDQFNRFNPDTASGVGSIEFSDDSSVSRAWLDGNVPDEDGSVRLFGTEENDVLTGGDGNEIINAGDGDDTITGGKGDDELEGLDGNDIYIWTPGDGNDIINDVGFGDELNTLRLVGANFADFELARDPDNFDNLILTYNPTGEIITITSQLFYKNNIERMEFADGTILTAEQININYPYVGTSDEDNLYSYDYDTDDTFEGLQGDDYIEGGYGSDTYVWSVGDGNDIIIEPSPLEEDIGIELSFAADDAVAADDPEDFFGIDDINILRLKGVTESDISFERSNPIDRIDTTTLDLIVRIAPNDEEITIREQLSLNQGLIRKIVLDDESEISLAGLATTLPIIGTDDQDYLIGGFAGETIDGKAGDDLIDAGAGSDTIIWRKGDGNDEITVVGETANEDILQLVDVASDGVVISRGEAPSGSFSDDPTVDDLIITITETSETIIIRSQFSQTTGSGGEVFPSDEVALSSAPLARNSEFIDTFSLDVSLIPGIEKIVFSDDETLSRETIAEQLDPDGRRLIGGTDDDDTIEGTSSNDLLIGGLGNDAYMFDRGSAEDIIADSGGDDDYIQMGPGVTPEALTLQRIDDDLLIEVAGQDRLTLTIANQFQQFSDEVIEGIHFDSGLVWTVEDIEGIILNGYITNGDDVIQGYNSADTIHALGGNDEIIVNGGSDEVDGGDGYDTVVLSSNSSRYLIDTTDDGTIISDRFSDEIKVLKNVEVIRFSNGEELSLVPNEAPDAGSVAAAGYVNQALTILAHDIVSAATDPEGETLSLVSVSGAVNGSVALNVDGDIIFTPDADYSGEASFSYEITDGTHTVSGSAAILVSLPNIAPTVANELADQTSEEDTAVNFTIPEDAFSDADGDDLTYSAELGDGTALPSWLLFDGDSRTFSGTPPTDFDGELDVTVIASDGAAQASDTFTLDITPVNDAPIVTNELANQFSLEDEAVSFSIPEDAFSDVDNTDLTLSATLGDGTVLPDWLVFDATARTFSGTPPLNFNVSVNVTVTASDGEFEVSDTFTLNITPVNDAPTVANALADQSSDEDTEVNFTIPEDAFSDVDSSDLIYSTGDIPDWLDFNNTTRTFQGTPPLNFNGSINVSVKASDGEFEVSDTFTLTITPVNDAPIVANALIDQSSPEDEEVNFAIPADAFSDVDSTELTLSAAGLPDWLTFDATTSTFSGTPPLNFDGSLDITVTASDGEHEVSDTFTLNIVSVNDAPIVANALADQSSPEDTAVSFAIPADAFTDVDSDDLTLSASGLPDWLTFDATTSTFSGTPPLNFDGEIEVTVTASDGEHEVSDMFTLDITPVNDAPIVANALADQSSPEDEEVNFAIPADAFSDVDSTELTLSAAGLPDWLTFDATTSTFSGTPPLNFDGSLDITVTASDGEHEVSDTFTLNIVSVNDAPIVANALADQSSPEDTAVSFAIPADAFTDVDSDDLTLSASGLPDWLTFDATTSTFSGTPPLNFDGEIEVTVTASDGEHEVSDMFTLDITPVNDAPIVANALADQSSPEDEEVNFAIPADAFSDVDSTELTLSAAGLPDWLTFDATTSTFSGTPPLNFDGEIEVTVTASDGEHEVSDMFTLDITPVNDAPIVANALADQSSPEDEEVNFAIPADAFSDVDSTELTLSAAGLPDWLTFDATTNTFSGTPPLNFDGSLDITVTASDGEHEVSDTFTLNIVSVNDAPIVANALADQSSPEDTAVSFAIPADAFTDVDSDDLTLSASGLPDWLTFDATTSTFSGTPPLNFDGEIEVTVTASDGEHEVSDMFTLDITPVNDAPIVANALADQSSPEDEEVNFAIPADAFSDVDSTELTLSAAGLPDWLTFDATTSTFSGTPPLNFDGEIEVTVTASDGEHEVSDMFTLDITPVNDAPIVANALADQSSPEDEEVNFAIPADAFSDVDSTELTLSAAGLPDWLTFDATTNTFSGTPPLNFDGSLDITVTASDGEHEVSDTFTLNIVSVNDAPIVANALADQSSPEDTAVSFAIPADAFTDVDSDDLTLSASGLPDWLTFDATTSTFSGTPPQDFNGEIEVTVTASDGEHEVSDMFTLEITPVNDEPEANDDEGFETSAGAALTIAAADLLANDTDADGDDLTISSVATSSGNGTVTLDAALNVVYTPNAGFTGDDSFTYTVSDGNGGFSTATVSVTVAAGNAAPIVANEIEDQTSQEDTAVSFTIPEDTFSDADGDELTYSAELADGSALPSWLSFDADTLTFSGTPPLNFDGSLDVSVTASDGDLETSDTFTLDITSVNDAPVLDNPLADQTSEEDTALSFTIPADAFSDPDDDELTYSAGLAEALPQNDGVGASADEPATVPLPDWLTFDPETLTFSGTPPLNFFGTIDVVVTATDPDGLSESDTFTLEITPVNDAPVLAGPLDDQTSEEDTAVSFTIPEFAFTDVDNNLTFRTSTLPAWLAFDASTLTFSGTPPLNYNGTVDVTVTASDGEFEVSDTFALEITPVNDGPVAVDDEGIEADAGTALTIAAADLLANDSDVEGDDLSIVAVESTSGNATVSLDGDGNVVYTASGDFDGDDNFTYTVSDGNGGTATATVSVSVEGDVTDPYEGWVVGTTGRDYLYGNFFSSNRIYGDDGNDRIYGGFRSDQLDGGEGNDRIYGRWGDDIINGDGGDDRIYGGSGNDTLNGGDGNDRLYGSWGNDTLNGGEGNDQLWGGWGQDNFVFNTGDGADTVRDFSTGFSWWWFRVAGDTITLDVDGIENYDDVLEAASQNGRHTTFDFGDGDSLTLNYTRLSSLDQDDFTIL